MVPQQSLGKKKRLESCWGPVTLPKHCWPVLAKVEYVPTPLNQQGARNNGNLSLDSGISFAEFEGSGGGLTGEEVFELRADLRDLLDRSAPQPFCLRFQGRYYSDPLGIGLAFLIDRAMGVLLGEDFLDPIGNQRAHACVGETKRHQDDSAQLRQWAATRPPQMDLPSNEDSHTPEPPTSQRPPRTTAFFRGLL